MRWLRVGTRNVSYCLLHSVYYPHQHSVDSPVCLPPHWHSYLVLLRADITQVFYYCTFHPKKYTVISHRDWATCGQTRLKYGLYFSVCTHTKRLCNPNHRASPCRCSGVVNMVAKLISGPAVALFHKTWAMLAYQGHFLSSHKNLSTSKSQGTVQWMWCKLRIGGGTRMWWQKVQVMLTLKHPFFVASKEGKG